MNISRTSVQQRIDDLETAYRKQQIARQKENQKYNDFIFDQRQIEDYPDANIVTLNMPTYESLDLPDETDEESDEMAWNILRNNLKLMGGGNGSFSKDMIIKMKMGAYTMRQVKLLNSSWTDVKKQVAAKLKGRASSDAVFEFMNLYLQITPTSKAAAEPKPVFKKAPQNATAVTIHRNILTASGNDPDIPHIIQSWESNNRKQLTGTTPKSELRTLEDEIYRATLGKLEGKGVTFGKGIMHENISSKLYVDVRYFNDNKLAVKYRSTKRLVSGPDAVSEKQKQVIQAILTDTFEKKMYDSLISSEKELVKNYVVLTKPQGKPLEITEVEQDLERFRVYLGSINAGNDSEQLRGLLKSTTQKLMKSKGLTKMQGMEILSQL
jgi:hypothetical protein